MPPRVLETLLETALAELDRPLTRPELAERIASSLGTKVLLRHGGGGWGNQRTSPWIRVGGVSLPVAYILHLVGARGVVCSGPSRANEATYVRADRWVPGFHDVPADEAEEELLRGYLRAFGPARVEDFAFWTGLRLRDARRVWDRVSSEIAPVEVAGELAGLLREDLGELPGPRPKGSVRLLPYFDSYLLGRRERDHLVEPRFRTAVFRGQGWVAPVVLAQGRVVGVWSHARNGSSVSVRVQSFAPLRSSLRGRIEEEALELGRFFGTDDVRTTFAPAASAPS
jgi:uncharacterized protein YcaQ